MECVNHPGAEPIGRCVVCGVLLCEACAVERDKIYCAACDPYATARKDLAEKQRLDVLRGLEYVFDDPDWLKKIVVGGFLLLFTPLVIPYLLILGYLVETIRAVAEERDFELPRWRPLLSKLEFGAKLVAVRLVYLIPLFLVLGGTSVLGLFGGETVRNQFFEGLLLALFTFGWLLAFALFIFVKFLRPSFEGLLAVSGSLEKSLGFRAVARQVFRRKTEYLTALAVSVILVPVIGISGFFFFFVGIIFTSFYALLLSAHITGQLARMHENNCRT